MGNKLGRRRQIVDERYTKPQGLYHHRDVDHKKLKKLILDSKLAPCYPGDDDCTYDLEDCPICFLYYPSLNRSRCCMKGICTECFLQLKNPNSAAPTQCPFCKASNYAVEYRGVKSKAERGLEHVEEQRVIEAKIRMMRQIHDEEEKKGTTTAAPAHDGGVLLSSEEPPSLIIASSVNASNRGAEFELDIEEIMLMEAIWHSVQEQGQDVKYHQQGEVIHSSLTVNHHHTPLVLDGSSTFEEQVMLATALSLTDSHHVPTCH